MIIQKKEWHTCKICGESIANITQQFSERGKYKTDYFLKHLSLCHGIGISSYFNNSVICPCGICGKRVGVKKHGANFYWKQYACGRNEGVVKWSKEAKEYRRGNNNPMFGKRPWNKNLDKTNNDSLQVISRKLTGRSISDETKNKQSKAAKQRLFHGHTGKKHSEKSKQLMRARTLEMIKTGRFPQTDTLPSRQLESLLRELNFSYEKEKTIGYWNFDFYLKDFNILLEADGDYWHSNPKIYPNGPVTKAQKVNYYRDIKKNQFCKNNKLALIRFWESDILGDKECVRQKLLALKR